jgi:hypothetical protein
MIVRILEEGQFEVPDDVVDALNDLDEQIIAAVDDGDETGFATTLQTLLERIRSAGSPTPPDYLGPSDLVLPASEATLQEVRSLLGDEGLIPG